MTQTPLVSIIIPTYNREKLLERAVKSALNQSYTNIEIWIVDDGSTEGTEAMIAAIRDKRINYVRMATNGGPSAARNVGIGRANGKYIAFLDSDDVWRTNKLEKQLAVLNSGCQAVFCQYLIHDEKQRVMPDEMEFDLNNTEHGFQGILLSQNKIGTPTLLLTKAAAEDVGGFNECLHTLEDWEYALRLTERYSVAFVPEILVDVFPTKGSVNGRRGSTRADALLCMLLRHWDKYEDKEVFDNMIRYLYEDMAFMDSGLQSISVPEGATYQFSSFYSNNLQSLLKVFHMAIHMLSR